MTGSRRGVLAGCLLGVASGWNLGNVGGVSSELAGAYGVPLVTVGLFTAALIATHTLTQIPGGLASDRFGPARAGAAALGLIALGDLIALSAPEPAVALAGRAVTGLGTGLAFIAGSALVQQSGGSPFAQGVFGGLGLGAAGLALAIVPMAEEPLGWRAPFWTSLALAVACAVPLLGAGSPARAGGQVSRRPGTRLRLFADERLRRLAVLYSATYGVSVVLGNWTVEMLERHGSMSDAAAAATGSLTLLLVAITRPLGGWVLRAHPDLTRTAIALSLAAGAAGTAAIAVADPPWLAAIGAALVGIGAGVSFAPAFTAAALARPDAPAAAIGAVNTVANAVVLVGTPLLGLSFSMPGDGRLGFAAVVALWAAALLFVPSREALGRAAPAVSGT